MSKQISYNIINIPHSITGCGLGNLGAALLLLNFAYNEFDNDNNIILISLVYIHVIIGISMFCLHVGSILCCDVLVKIKDILSIPSKIIFVGIYTIALTLISKLITLTNCFDNSNNNSNNSLYIGISLLLIATCMSLCSMGLFVTKCYKLSIQPEPYFCIAMCSSLFPAALMPPLEDIRHSNPLLVNICSILQDCLVGIGLCLLPMMLVVCYRVFCSDNCVNTVTTVTTGTSGTTGSGSGTVEMVDMELELELESAGLPTTPTTPTAPAFDCSIVANNPTVAIMQAGPSVLLSAWMRHPLIPPPSPITHPVTPIDTLGGVIIHCLFGFAWVVCISSIIALYHRRYTLMQLHPTHDNSHQWASVTFPFFNTALASYGYSRLYTNVPLWLSMWIGVICCLSYVNMTCVNGLFIYNICYSGKPNGNSSASGNSTGTASASSSNSKNDMEVIKELELGTGTDTTTGTGSGSGTGTSSGSGMDIVLEENIIVKSISISTTTTTSTSIPIESNV